MKKLFLDIETIPCDPTSKDEMDGSQVWPKYMEGKISEIGIYCMKDVELTSKVYHRLQLEEPPFESTVIQEDIPF